MRNRAVRCKTNLTSQERAFVTNLYVKSPCLSLRNERSDSLRSEPDAVKLSCRHDMSSVGVAQRPLAEIRQLANLPTRLRGLGGHIASRQPSTPARVFLQPAAMWGDLLPA